MYSTHGEIAKKVLIVMTQIEFGAISIGNENIPLGEAEKIKSLSFKSVLCK